jgi:putative ABC transport system permease protein
MENNHVQCISAGAGRMTILKLTIKSLLFYSRVNIALILAAAVTTATLTGALLVGDSVKATLKYAFEARLGRVKYAVAPGDRFFTEGLSARLKKQGIETAPVLRLSGMVTRGDGAVRVNNINVLGVDERFFNMSKSQKTPVHLIDGEALINTALTGRLISRAGMDNEVVLRFDNPSMISRNIILAPLKESTVSVRLPVTGTMDDMHFGRFSLESNQAEPLNLYVPITWLQKQIRLEGAANLLLIANNPVEYDADKIDRAISNEWDLSDAGAVIKTTGENTIELVSPRVFIDTSLSDAALKAEPDAIPILTYFVNRLVSGNSFTPYSMVTAAERKGAFINILPEGMKDDEIVINDWLADDLDLNVGDFIILKYFRPDGWQKLEEAERAFRVCRVIPIEGAGADRSLAPDLPGLSDAENCSEWHPSIPIDLDLIRDKDEAYWDNYRGTPKAFVTLAAGKAMWANSYGTYTAIRFQEGMTDKKALEENILRLMNPANTGLS